MGQWLIDVGADKALGVLIIVASFYFGLKMFLMSRDPRKDIVRDPRPKGEAFSDSKKPRKDKQDD
jgi:hypothetical protein